MQSHTHSEQMWEPRLAYTHSVLNFSSHDSLLTTQTFQSWHVLILPNHYSSLLLFWTRSTLRKGDFPRSEVRLFTFMDACAYSMSSRLKWQQWLRLFLQNSCTSCRLYRLSAKDMVSLRQISGAARGGVGHTQGWEGQQEGRREIRQSLCFKRGRWQEINILLPTAFL